MISKLSTLKYVLPIWGLCLLIIIGIMAWERRHEKIHDDEEDE